MKKHKLRRWLRTLGLLILIGLVAVFAFFFAVKYGAFGPLPGSDELGSIRNATATQVYSSDDKLIGKIFAENRTNTNLEDLPQHLLDALVATEDVRFYKHEGIDERSLLRVLVKSLLLRDERSGGGSTITQQLAKNLYGRRDFGFLSLPVNKCKEILLAQRLEELYSKEQILEFYLNTVPFSENTYGIESASYRFFNKAPSRLKLEESAVLVGMLKANTYYNPRLYPQHARSRRTTVLQQMHKYGYLSDEELDSLLSLPLVLDYNTLREDSYAPYFMKQLRQRADELLSKIGEQGGDTYDLERDGLRIYTTLNMEMQQAADGATQKHMAKLQSLFDKHWKGRDPWGSKESIFDQALEKSRSYKTLLKKGLSPDSLEYYLNDPHPVQLYYPGGDTVMDISIRDSVAYYIKLLNCGFLAMEPEDGKVLAWVGGLNHRFMPYDHVHAKRQAASTFKPIVYATALSQGMEPCDYMSNELQVYEDYDYWTPSNYDADYEGYYSMKGALSKSVNTIAVKTLFEAGLSNVQVMARELGVSSDVPSNPSIALGTASISLYDMVRVYAVFANGGLKVEPYFIERIESAEGETIYQRVGGRPEERVITEDVADMITHMLEGVVNEGTARKLRSTYGLSNDLAGKTGTAQDYSDGWFVGYNPRLVVGVWVGASNPAVHFRSGRYGSGSAMAMPVFANFFKEINRSPDLSLYRQARFKELSPELQLRMDCPNYREERLIDPILEFLKRQRREQEENDDEEPYRPQRPNKRKQGLLDRIFKRER